MKTEEGANLLSEITSQMTVEEAFVASGGYGRYQVMINLLSSWIYTGHMVFLYSLPFFQRNMIICEGDSLESCTVEEVCDNNYKYEYNDPHKSTIISEFNLLCEKSFIGWIGTCYFIGYIIANYFVASTSERIGRRLTLIVELIISSIGMGIFVLSSAANASWMLLLGSVIAGVGTAYAGPGNNLSFDAVKSSDFNKSLAIINSHYGTMEVIIGAIMYINYGWKVQIYALIGWSILLCIVLCFMSEGPRFHVFRKRYDKATAQFHRIAKMNKRGKNIPLNMSLVVPGKEDDTPQHNFLDVFKHKSTRYAFLLLVPMSFVCHLVYFGIAMDMTNLGGNMQLNCILAGVFEIVAYLSSMVLIDTRLGRKWTMLGYTFIASLGFGLQLTFYYLDYDNTYLIAGLVILKKLGISGTFNVQELLTQECFPSEIRSSVMGVVILIGSIGSLVAPMIVQVIPEYVAIIFTVFCVFATILCLLCPETKGKILSDVFTDTLIQTKTIMSTFMFAK